MQKLSDDFKGKGVAVLGVNDSDTAEAVQRRIDKAKLTFRMVLQGTKICDDYRVEAFPTTYVVGPDGKVAYAGPSYDDKAIREVLTKLAP